MASRASGLKSTILGAMLKRVSACGGFWLVSATVFLSAVCAYSQGGVQFPTAVSRLTRGARERPTCLPDLVAFGRKHRMPVLTIEDLVQYRQLLSERTA